MTKENPITMAANREIAEHSNVAGLLVQIRPEWQAKKLTQRVVKLLPVDPSSACQRLFNAAVHDLKKKIQIAGLDIAKEAASANRLPQVNRAEDIAFFCCHALIQSLQQLAQNPRLRNPHFNRVQRAVLQQTAHTDSASSAAHVCQPQAPARPGAQLPIQETAGTQTYRSAA